MGAAVVNEEELLMMNGYDQLQGLSPLNKRNLFKTSRVSTLLHWKLLQRQHVHKHYVRLSSTVSTDTLPSELEEGFHDAHCHLDRLFNVCPTSATFIPLEMIGEQRSGGR